MSKPSPFQVVEGDRVDEGKPPLVDENIATLTPDTIEELRRKHLLREAESNVELPSFSAGQEKIGILNDEERAIFCEIATLDAVLDDWQKEIIARTHEKLAVHVRKTDTPKEALEGFAKDMVFESDEEAEEYFGEVYRRDYLSALFWYNVRLRLGVFGANLAICHGFAVARAGYKYKTQK